MRISLEESVSTETLILAVERPREGGRPSPKEAAGFEAISLEDNVKPPAEQSESPSYSRQLRLKVTNYAAPGQTH
jgi:hypothetical protein